MSMLKVSVIGLGYIGLPTAALLAARGVAVVGVDINPTIVTTINEGKIHIVEPELDVLVHGAVNAGNLQATTQPVPANVFIIAVPTPITAAHAPDITYVQAAAKLIAPVLQAGNLIILESTSPVGTTEQLSQWLAEVRPELKFPLQATDAADINIAYCPERVLPGRVIKELVENDRVVGGITPTCTQAALNFYQRFVQGECLATNSRTAEMTKLAENAFRDVNIAYANELSIVCEQLKINVWELIKLANHHPRVNILQPGPGVGGHCIAVDPWFIAHSAPQHTPLIQAARYVNDNKPQFILEKIRHAIDNASNPVVACLGLAFKANIDDLRESPALHIMQELAEHTSCHLLVVEPHIENLPAVLANYAHVQLVDLQTAIAQATIIVLLVDHQEFFAIEHAKLQNKTIIDTRGVL